MIRKKLAGFLLKKLQGKNKAARPVQKKKKTSSKRIKRASKKTARLKKKDPPLRSSLRSSLRTLSEKRRKLRLGRKKSETRKTSLNALARKNLVRGRTLHRRKTPTRAVRRKKKEAQTPPIVHETLVVQETSTSRQGPSQALVVAQPQQLSAGDLIHPSDQLKRSIEGFLLDQRSPHTKKAYGKDLKRLVQFLHLRRFEKGIETIDRHVLIGYKDFLLSEKLEHTTIDRHIATLRSFFQWLVEDGILTKSPAEGMKFLNPKKLSTTIGFSDEEVREVLKLPDLHTRTGSMHYAILMVLFYCGLRRSEVCSLRTTEIGTERNQKVLKLRGKGNAERLIVIIPPVWNAIQHYFYISARNLKENGYLFIPLRNNRTGLTNKPLDPSMIFYIVTRYAKLAGISNRVSPHSCRATAISNARDHHVPDRAIQEFAGWASPDMITRYDKRRTSVEDSAAHAIQYGSENRALPTPLFRQEALEAEPEEVTTDQSEGHPTNHPKQQLKRVLEEVFEEALEEK